MDALPTKRIGLDLHGPFRVVSPTADADPGKSRAARRKERGVPREQALTVDLHVTVRSRVEHHLHETLCMSINRRQCTDVLTETAGTGWANSIAAELPALDLARSNDVRGERDQAGLALRQQADIGKSPHPCALRSARLGQRRGKHREIAAPVRPIVGLPDISMSAASHAVVVMLNRRRRKLNTASFAKFAIGFPARNGNLAYGRIGCAGAAGLGNLTPRFVAAPAAPGPKPSVERALLVLLVRWLRDLTWRHGHKSSDARCLTSMIGAHVNCAADNWWSTRRISTVARSHAI